MKSNDLKKRLRKNRPMTTISLQIPEDVVEDLKRIAPLRGISGYIPLIRAYIGQGLRQDLAQLETMPNFTYLIESLRRHGVDDGLLALAISEVNSNSAETESSSLVLPAAQPAFAIVEPSLLNSPPLIAA